MYQDINIFLVLKYIGELKNIYQQEEDFQENIL
jgi:hypothetical protein